jgi:o-succinylbenzoate---CoA ligase
VNEIVEFSKTISDEISIFLEEWFNNNSFVEVKTSGSTGKPKLIQLQKKYMINSAKATGEYFNLPEKTSALLCMSPNYIAGKMMIVRALTLGWNMDVIEPTSHPLKNIDKEYDFAAMVPLQLHNSLNDIQRIKKLIVGGGIVTNELLSKIQNVETNIFATYGMTETITHIAVKKLNNFNSVIAREEKQSIGSEVKITSGDTLLRNDVIESEAKQSVKKDVEIPSQAENEVHFRHAELVSASHYNVLPNISISKDNRGCLIIDAPKISSKKIITNDLVELISDSTFKWLGRFDTIINSGGIKLMPEQIEAKLSDIITQRFFVAGISDVLLGEKLILVIEDQNNLNKDVILNRMKNLQLLSKYEIPKEIYFLGQFSETETKKINRRVTLKILAKNFN